MPRKTVKDIRLTHLPISLGLCREDVSSMCEYLNEAQQRLVPLGPDTGWHGAYDRLVFAVDRADPYIILGREYARIQHVAVCRRSVQIRNEFYELLLNGIGLKTPSDIPDPSGVLQAFERGTVPTQRALTATNQLLRVYPTVAADAGKRILIKGKDQYGNTLWDDDGSLRVEGTYLTLVAPFTTSAFVISEITGIVKDATKGDVLLYQVDATTGAEVLLARLGPDETTTAYRKYFLYQLPTNCCDGASTVQVTALVKREPLPLSRDTDFLVIQSIPALTEECQSIRLLRIDDPNSKAAGLAHHREAIRRLREELDHYEGKQTLATVFSPEGTAKFEDRGIGNMI